MSDPVSRRTFVRSAALGVASAAAMTTIHRSAETAPPVDPRTTMPDLDWQKAPCRFCGTGCHVLVGVKNGKVAAIAGDPEADVNKGLLCV
ncbi:MAG TPA: hypothetical protein PKW66_18285, partial [Polyangiaceae bacterium]|nr:hypothetical protein [Polyangiaceae bacterium]